MRASSILAPLLLALAAPAALAGDDVELGRLIYQEGVRAAGAPLVGARADGTEVSGRRAACAACHRKSGMGGVEGTLQVPPITGGFLFARHDDGAIATMDRRGGKSFNLRHEPYTDESLARAVGEGTNNAGRRMQVMPRYGLNETEMRSLTAYLRQLSAEWSPGVSADTIRFATVITPGVDPARRAALVDTLRAAFAQKNGSTVLRGFAGGRRHMVSAAEMILGTERLWALDVWELTGPAETWGRQLDDLYRQRPVFALVSGLSADTWAPMHEFCDRQQVPCWFPNAELAGAPDSFYSLYFSRGVALEAEVLARHLAAMKELAPARLVQLHRGDAVGRAAAQALTHALAGSGIAVDSRLVADAPDGLRQALAGLGSGDALMLWLRPADLAALAAIDAPPAAAYVSAELAGGEQGPLPAAWKAKARLVYPFELPAQRAANMEYFHAWLKTRKLDLVDERLQAQTYFAVDYLTETLGEMLDNVHRDYLIERAEDMLGKREGAKAEERARDRAMLGRGLTAKRDGTTLYPRLSLAPGQRHASKGAYIVRFGEDGRLVAETDWIVP